MFKFVFTLYINVVFITLKHNSLYDPLYLYPSYVATASKRQNAPTTTRKVFLSFRKLRIIISRIKHDVNKL